MGIEFLPTRIKEYLNTRGLPDTVLERNKITWDGERIVIPVFDPAGLWLFNKYRRDPDVSFGPKYTYDKGAQSALYGADKALAAQQVIICEGEFDSLVLEAQGFTAVCSTGGAGTFKEEWLQLLLLEEKELFICFDNDAAGEAGIVRIARMCPAVKWVPLPPAVGDHGDLTDYFTKLGKTAKDFRISMEVAMPIELPKEPTAPKRSKRKVSADQADRMKAAKEVPLTLLLKFNPQKFARCPFHADKTPSLHLFGANRWKCFSCGDRGDGIDLVMRMNNLKLQDAIDYLLKL